MLCIVTSEKETIEYKDVQSAKIEATTGTLQILPGHAECFLAFLEGRLELLTQGDVVEVKHPDGFCHIKDDTITVIV